MLAEVKKILGLSNEEFDTTIEAFINGAKKDLVSVGIVEAKVIESDPLIKIAIITYVKSQFDERNRESLQNSYDIQKDNLRRKSEYNQEEA